MKTTANEKMTQSETILHTMCGVYAIASDSATFAESIGTPIAEYREKMCKNYKEARAYRNRVSEDDNATLLAYTMACAKVNAWMDVLNQIRRAKTFEDCRRRCAWLIDRLVVDPA